MGIFNEIWRKRWVFRAIFPSIIFNFKHLPFSQACRLPILLYKADLLNTSGQFIISGPVKFGMIRLGVFSVGIHPNNGIIIENSGSIIFRGKTVIGNNSALSIGKTGVLELGENFAATSGLKLVCYHSVTTEKNVLIGWNTYIVDTDFHLLKNMKLGGVKSRGFGPIKIGHDVWIANGCKIYKNVSIPNSCVVGADTILHKAVECPPNSLITNKIETSIKTDIFYDRNDDKIKYPEHEA